jgi:hypothetical protein
MEEDLHTSRMVAKMHWLGWGFCRTVNTVHRFDVWNFHIRISSWLWS